VPRAPTRGAAADEPAGPGGLQDHGGGQGALPGAARRGRTETFEDTGFGVHFAFFSAPTRTALRILEGPPAKDRGAPRGHAHVAVPRRPSDSNAYTLELQRHGLEACDAKSVGWRSSSPPSAPAASRATRLTRNTALSRLRTRRSGRDDRRRHLRWLRSRCIVGVGNCASSLVQAWSTTAMPTPTRAYRVSCTSLRRLPTCPTWSSSRRSTWTPRGGA